MTTMEGEPAASVGDIGQLGDECAFTLFDSQEREIAAFVFRDERDARQAHKMMNDIVARAVAISPAEERGFVAVPIRGA
jgi:hypothetical protein